MRTTIATSTNSSKVVVAALVATGSIKPVAVESVEEELVSTMNTNMKTNMKTKLNTGAASTLLSKVATAMPTKVTSKVATNAEIAPEGDAVEAAEGDAEESAPPKMDFSVMVARGGIQSVTMRAALSDMEKEVVHEGLEAALKEGNNEFEGLRPAENLEIDEDLKKEACSQRFGQICQATIMKHAGVDAEEIKFDEEILQLADKVAALKDQMISHYRTVANEAIAETEKAIREPLKDLPTEEQMSTLTKAVAKSIVMRDLMILDQRHNSIMNIFRALSAQSSAPTADNEDEMDDELTSSIITPDSNEASETPAAPEAPTPETPAAPEASTPETPAAPEASTPETTAAPVPTVAEESSSSSSESSSESA
eukprot:Protomagalhaensia_wolfi_Nauph_80__1291@NODE_1767_length_1351_cov_472_695122_g1375_i0_p1_GENE_NODE_1767_length_1351_cov_472_695122_g1375_i0NODE_1767_length_1351_cov_472_695122_g1375_i0_p1_ORF_typecomplete_len368_score117_62Upf2/PF04050_14/0_052Upf2/PF04050_14/9_7e03_NODE_1767_length_1351_cov_472_695122_g1375_i01261229